MNGFGRFWIGLCSVLLVFGAVAAGCSSTEPLPFGEGQGGESNGPGHVPCEEGAVRVCGKTLEIGSGAMVCYRGQETCRERRWSACEGGEITREPLPSSLGLVPHKRSLLALSSPITCSPGTGTGGGSTIENPCDAGCMYFREDPDDLNASGGSSSGPPVVLPPRTCEASVCEVTPGGLDIDCDPCVARVCQAHPTCCTTNWGDDCAFWATTTCANQLPPLGLCDFGLLADTNLDLRNKASTATTIGAYGDITLQADSDFGSIYGLGNVRIENLNGYDIYLDTGGGIFTNGSIGFSASPNSDVYGTLRAGTAVDVSNVKVHGDVYAGTNILGQLGGAITDGAAYARGTIASSLNVPNRNAGSNFTPIVVSLPPRTGSSVVPTLPITCPTGGANQTANNINLTPGTYGAIELQNNGQLRLRGQGTYYLQSLAVTGTILLDLNGETLGSGWDVRVCGSSNDSNAPGVWFNNSARIVGSWPGANDAIGVLRDPKYLTLFFRGITPISMGVDVYWVGVLMAPNAPVTKSTMNSYPTKEQILNGTRSAPVTGAIWAKGISLDVGALTKGIDSDDCKGIDVLDGLVDEQECPVDGGVRDLKNEPCESGLDCQANSRCVEPDSSACAHGVCATGAALSASCSDCARRICQVDPGCCATTWSSSCVAKVATVCDARCESTCTQDACSVGAAPIAATCDDNTPAAGCIDAVCAALPTCCTQTWTQACVNRLYAECGSNAAASERLCDYAAYGWNDLNPDPGVTLTPAAEEQLDVDMPPIPFNCQAGGQTPTPTGGVLTFDPAIRYDLLNVPMNTRVVFPTGGTYRFNRLDLQGNNIIELPPAPAEVNIIVCGQVRIGASTTYVGIDATSPLRLRIYSNYNGPNAIVETGQTPAQDRFGLLVAPYGEVVVGFGSRHYGAIWGRDARIVNSAGTPASIQMSGPAIAECKAKNLDGGGACPVVLTGGVGTGTPGRCVDNAPGYVDPSCATYDLAAGTPCGGTVPVCNHGSGAFGGALTIGYYDYDLGQMAIEDPLVSPTGVCSRNVSIPSGQCVDVACEIEEQGLHTLRIDPEGVLAECNGRRLDNWTASDGRACVPFSQPRTETFEYEAECPSASRAKWGLLVWDSVAPGQSEIRFSVKVGQDQADLEAQSFTLMATASRALGTERCPYVDSTPCYADLSGLLNLGANQGQHLVLQVELLPQLGSPVLRDWAISYSCAYDE